MEKEEILAKSTNKIGMFIHRLTPDVYNAMVKIQPGTVTIMDPSLSQIKDIYDAIDGTVFVVARWHEDTKDFWRHVDPGDYARELYSRLEGGPYPDAIMGPNEAFGHDNAELFEAFDAWQVGFVLALQALGIEAVTNCFGTGNFTGGADRIKITDAFPRTCAVSKYMGPHDYDWDVLWRTVGWRALRWVKWLEDIEAAGMEAPWIIVGEIGLTRATYTDEEFPGCGPDVGWQTLDPDINIAIDRYLESLRWGNQQLCAIERCIGSCTFDWGAGGHWGFDTFLHEPYPRLVEAIRDLQAPDIPEDPDPTPEPTPDPGDDMDIKVIDLDYNESTMEWAKSRYGVEFTRTKVAPGQPVYRLIELRAKVGPATLITKVVDKNGNPIVNQDVAFYWPDAPEPPNPPTAVYAHDWHRNFVHGPTNANGDVGPGMGTGAYFGEGAGGPHKVWVRDPNIPSDVCRKLGMIAGTFHEHLDQVFALVIEGGGPMPTPTPDPGEDNVGEWKEKHRKFTGGVPAQIHLHLSGGEKPLYIDLRGNMNCGSWELEDLVYPEPEGEIGCRFEFGCTYPQEEERRYRTWVLRLPTYKRVSDMADGVFSANPAERGKWDIYLAWTPEPTPEPEPTPDGDIPSVDGSALDILNSLEGDIDALASINVDTIKAKIRQLKGLLAG